MLQHAAIRLDPASDPSPIPAARYSMAVLKGRRFNNDPDKAIVVSNAPMISAQVAKSIE